MGATKRERAVTNALMRLCFGMPRCGGHTRICGGSCDCDDCGSGGGGGGGGGGDGGGVEGRIEICVGAVRWVLK